MSSNSLGYYLAAMIATSVAVPFIMIAITLVVYISWSASSMALVIGMVGGCAGWLLLTIAGRDFVGIEWANPTVYHELHSRFAVLYSQRDFTREVLRTVREGEAVIKEEDRVYFIQTIYPRLESASAALDAQLGSLTMALGDPGMVERTYTSTSGRPSQEQ